jgi:hypothetical protein
MVVQALHKETMDIISATEEITRIAKVRMMLLQNPPRS